MRTMSKLYASIAAGLVIFGVQTLAVGAGNGGSAVSTTAARVPSPLVDFEAEKRKYHDKAISRPDVPVLNDPNRVAPQSVPKAAVKQMK